MVDKVKEIADELKKRFNGKELEELAANLTKGKKKSKKMAELDEVIEKGYQEAAQRAQEAGKGRIGQFRAGLKGAREKQEQLQIAKLGTTRKYANILGMFGVQTGSFFNKYIEKRATKEQQESAKKQFGMDEESLRKKKEEAEQKKAERISKKEGAVGDRTANRQIFKIKDLVSTLVKDLTDVKRKVDGISKVLLVKRGFKAEIDEKGKVVYRSTKEGSKGQYAKEEDASAVYSRVSMKRGEKDREAEAKVQKERSSALASKISADEDPQIRIADTLEAILKSLGQGDVSIHEKLNRISSGGSGGGLLDTAADIASLASLRRGGKGAIGKIGGKISAVKRLAGMKISKMGKGLGALTKIGGGAAAVGAAATGIGANVGAGMAQAGAAAGGAGAAAGGAAAGGAAAKAGASKTLVVAKKVLGFMKKVPGLSLIASGATMLMEMSDAIKAHEKGEIDDAKLHAVMAGAVGGALGGAGGSTLLATVGASAGSIIPGYGTVIGGLLGGIGGFLAGERIGRFAFEKIWSFFESGGTAPAEAFEKKDQAKSPPAAGAPPKAVQTAAAPPTTEAPPPVAEGAAPIMQAPKDIEPSAGGAPPAAPAAPATGGGADKDVKDMIKRHEGVRFRPYKDSLGLWTVGVGHLIGDGKTLPPEYNREFSAEEVDAMFNKDFEYHQAAAMKIPGYNKLNRIGQGALTDLTFNMGPTWYKKWPKFTKFISQPNVEGAAQSLENSKWYTQVGRRAPTIVSMIRAGGGGGTTPETEEPSAPPPSSVPSEPSGGGAVAAAGPATSGGAPAAEGGAAASGAGGATGVPGAESGGLLASIKTDTSSILQALQALQSNLGSSMSTASDEFQNNQMIAQNQPPPEPVIINNGGATAAPSPGPKQSLPKALSRNEDGSFLRALAKDFSHPTAFTTASMV